MTKISLPRWSPLSPAAMSRAVPLAFALAVALAPSWARAQDDIKDPHAEVYQENAYPSARVCKGCHEQIYWEWASSNHGYASISPMFHKFEQRINDLASGTIDTFCVRCHQQVGTQRGEPREQPLWERSKVSSEGVTCITCHRVKEEYLKVNGERSIVPGTINQPMYGTARNSNIGEVLKDPDFYKVDPTGTGRGAQIHNGVIPFEQLGKSEFCEACHQVAVHPGIKLEVVWDQYRDSPAVRQGITCQQCHMGAVPGRADGGYTKGPAAIVNGHPIGEGRDHHNHAFYGPGYPIAHPGIFPHNPDADRWSYQDWLKYDFRAGWGTDDFENMAADADKDFDALDKAADAGQRQAAIEAIRDLAKQSKLPGAEKAYADFAAQAKGGSPEQVKAAEAQLRSALGLNFPQEWVDTDDRADARKVVEYNLDLLKKKKDLRQAVMDNGSRIDGPFFSGEPRVGQSLSFTYKVSNTDIGHNLPSGSLGAQPEIWLNVALIDPDGKRVFESGYVDSIGDMANLHSVDVLSGKLPHDDQLFNLQTMFLVTSVTGTDREFPLPVNFEGDQRPFARAANVPTTVLNHPPGVRMESRSLPPTMTRDANYTAPASALSKPGKYRLAVRLRSRAEPIYFMRFVNATSEMEQAMNEWMLEIHPYTVEFDVK
jgi:Cytochrome c554 and c-prime